MKIVLYIARLLQNQYQCNESPLIHKFCIIFKNHCDFHVKFHKIYEPGSHFHLVFIYYSSSNQYNDLTRTCTDAHCLLAYFTQYLKLVMILMPNSIKVISELQSLSSFMRKCVYAFHIASSPFTYQVYQLLPNSPSVSLSLHFSYHSNEHNQWLSS